MEVQTGLNETTEKVLEYELEKSLLQTARYHCWDKEEDVHDRAVIPCVRFKSLSSV